MNRLDVLSIGSPMVEFKQTRPGDPHYLQGFGGDTSNMAIAAARRGARTGYVARIGDDEFGRLFLALWRAEGVDTRGASTMEELRTQGRFAPAPCRFRRRPPAAPGERFPCRLRAAPAWASASLRKSARDAGGSHRRS